jgi:hypothetical protein
MEYGKTLATAVGRRLDRSLGKIFSIWVDSGGHDEIYWFNRSVSVPDVCHEETTTVLVEYIRRYLAARPERIVVCVNANARKGDPWLTRAKSQVVYHGLDVYHILTSLDIEPNSILLGVNESSSGWRDVVLFSSLPDGIRLKENTEFDDFTLDVISQATVALAIGAYDLDSYLIWELTLNGENHHFEVE